MENDSKLQELIQLLCIKYNNIVTFNAHMLQKIISYTAYHKNYNSYPLEISEILLAIYPNNNAFIAALLSAYFMEINEETVILRLQKVQEDFGIEVASIVDGIIKLSKIDHLPNTMKQQKLFRFFLSMRKAIVVKVLFIKLSYLLHNISIFNQNLSFEQKIITILEIMEIYIPLIEKIGLGNIKIELQEICLHILQPDVRKYILEHLYVISGNNKTVLINKIINTLRNNLDVLGIKAKIFGRIKSPYSIWLKMLQKNINIYQLHDVLAFMIVVNNVEQCYEVLNMIHKQYKVVEGQFEDYIRMPKSNGYQSLHTVVIGPTKKNIEIQIRTEVMNKIAKGGKAAHWKYKKDSLRTTRTIIYNIYQSLYKTTYSLSFRMKLKSKEYTRFIKQDLQEVRNIDINNEFPIVQNIKNRFLLNDNNRYQDTWNILNPLELNRYIETIAVLPELYNNSASVKIIMINLEVDYNNKNQLLNNQQIEIPRYTDYNNIIITTSSSNLNLKLETEQDFYKYQAETISNKGLQQNYQHTRIKNTFENINDQNISKIQKSKKELFILNDKQNLKHPLPTIDKSNTNNANNPYDRIKKVTALLKSNKEPPEIKDLDLFAFTNISTNQEPSTTTITTTPEVNIKYVREFLENPNFNLQKQTDRTNIINFSQTNNLRISKFIENHLRKIVSSTLSKLEKYIPNSGDFILSKKQHSLDCKNINQTIDSILTLESIIKEFDAINIRDNNDDTKFSLAIKENNVQDLKELLTLYRLENNIVNINTINQDGHSPLMLALLSKNVEIILLLTQVRDRKGGIVWSISEKEKIEFNRVFLPEILPEIFKGINQQIKDFNLLVIQKGIVELLIAILIEDIDTIERLASSLNYDGHNYCCSIYEYFLQLKKDYELSFTNDQKITKLLQNNIDPQNSDYNRISEAIKNNQLSHELIKSLDINDRGTVGNTVFFDAILNRNIDLINQLLTFKDQYGNYLVNPNLTLHCNCNTPLIQAATDGVLEIITILLELKDATGQRIVDINHTDINGSTAVLYAAEHGHTQIVKIFLELKDTTGQRIVDINHTDTYGSTAVLYAAQHGHTQIVKMFLELKDINGYPLTNINITNKFSSTVMTFFQGDNEMKQLLREYGAKELQENNINEIEDFIKNPQSTHNKYVEEKVAIIKAKLQEEFKDQNTREVVINSLAEIRNYIQLLKSNAETRKKTITFKDSEVTIGIRRYKTTDTISKKISTEDALNKANSMLDRLTQEHLEIVSLIWLKIGKNEKKYNRFELKSDLIKTLIQNAFEYSKEEDLDTVSNKNHILPTCASGVINALISTAEPFVPLGADLEANNFVKNKTIATEFLQNIFKKISNTENGRLLITDVQALESINSQNELMNFNSSYKLIQKLIGDTNKLIYQKYPCLSDEDFQVLQKIFDNSILYYDINSLTEGDNDSFQKRQNALLKINELIKERLHQQEINDYELQNLQKVYDELVYYNKSDSYDELANILVKISIIGES